jgi:hypothetical protein
LFKIESLGRNVVLRTKGSITCGDESSWKLFGKNPFFNGKTRFLRPAEKLHIEDPGNCGRCFFGLDVDLLKGAFDPVDGNDGLKRIVDSFHDDLPAFKSSQNDLELVLVKPLLTNNSISILLLDRIQFFTSAIFQNPVSIDRTCIGKIPILCDADIILDKVLVLTPLNEEKMTDFIVGGSKNRLGEKA